MNDATTATDHEHREFVALWSAPEAWRGALSAVNSQRLGLRFMLTALGFFAAGGVLALLIRVQLAVSDNTFLSPQLYNEIFTMHGSTMMYLFAVPFLEGLALYLIPYMIGSRDVAFPRLTAFSYWTYLFGGLIFYASFLAGGAPDAGWFAYTPLSGPGYAGTGLDFWVMGLALVEVAGLAAAIEIVVTILRLRAPGMSIRTMPIFAWTMLVSGVMMIFAFTVLLTGTLLLELDRVAGTRFFDPEHGGNSLLWQHLFWFFGHPEVYIMFLPATGIVSMIVPTAAQRPLAVYMLVVMAILLTGFISFGLWMHHMYVTGLPELGMSFFAAASLMIGVASGIQIFAWVATLWGTRPRLHTHMLYVLGFFFIFVLGGFTGVMVAVAPFDWQVHDTFFIVAHFHYVLIGGVVFPIFAGLHYWTPKITGRLLDERLGRWSFWLTFIGFNLTFFPMHIMGLLGLPRRVYRYPESLQLDEYNMVASAGAFIMAAGTLLIAWNVVRSRRAGAAAGNNPWSGGSLEWSTTSPPPVYGFLQPPVTTARDPLWSSRDAADPAHERATRALRGAPTTWRATLATDTITGRTIGIQVLAGPSLTPFLAATGLLVAMLGVLLKSYLLVPLGVIFAGACIVRWVYPYDEYVQRLRESSLPERAGVPIHLKGEYSTSWCGMLGFIIIAATAFGALFYSYFYLRLFSDTWPQDGLAAPQVESGIIIIAPLVLSSGALWWSARQFARTHMARALAGLWSAAGLWLLSLIAGGRHLATLPFDWGANAYASAYYVVLMTLMLVIAAAMLVLSVSAVRIHRARSHDDFYALLPLQLATMFGHFVAGAGMAVFAVLFLSPLIP